MSDQPHAKRRRDDGFKKKAPAGPPPEKSNNPFMPMFLTFRDELDEHHDRRERVIKTSRDITALSKKMIFSMQRARKLASPLPPRVSEETTTRLNEIHGLLTSISPDLQSINAHRYARQISGGLQELIEALAFRHYLETGGLLSYSSAQAAIPGGVELTVGDYLLGLFDFVGEVMRFAITMIAIGSRDGADGDADQILLDLRALRMEFEALETAASPGAGGPLARDIEKKMGVMKTCVEKVENAVYGVIVRGSEKPKGWVPDLSEPKGGGVPAGRGDD